MIHLSNFTNSSFIEHCPLLKCFWETTSKESCWHRGARMEERGGNEAIMDHLIYIFIINKHDNFIIGWTLSIQSSRRHNKGNWLSTLQLDDKTCVYLKSSCYTCVPRAFFPHCTSSSLVSPEASVITWMLIARSHLLFKLIRLSSWKNHLLCRPSHSLKHICVSQQHSGERSVQV